MAQLVVSALAQVMIPGVRWSPESASVLSGVSASSPPSATPYACECSLSLINK